ncbi:MAG: hemerythrin domain-containing protein [Acidobacteria bacterium]|nr:hemerythrin domain-containing protein [Acidobacteriota bacterium]
MKITHALRGEHGAIYPLLDIIQESAPVVGIESIRTQARILRATLMSHADIEDAVLRPAIERYLPEPAPEPDGSRPPSDHQRIRAGLEHAMDAGLVEEARRLLIQTVEAISRHFAKEEGVIFAIAECELPEEVQHDLGARWSALRRMPPAPQPRA